MNSSAVATERPKGHPKGLWVLVFTETFERMSFYGTRPLLMLYMTASVAMGGLGLSTARAAAIFAGYYLSLYVFALSGGQIADRFIGAKRTILLGGVFIAAGQLMLQVTGVNPLLFALMLISVGTCLLKPNISASVGKLYAKDDSRRDSAFTIEYAGINFGSVMAVLICGFMAGSPTFIRLLHKIGLDSPNGWAWAFAITGIGMLVSLVNFVLRRKLVNDVSLPEGQAEPKPAGLGFVAFQVAVVMGLAYLVISSDSLWIQLVAGIGGAVFLMFGVQAVINKGWVQTRTGAAVVAGAGHEEHHKLSSEDWSRIGVLGMMILFSIIFWALFQQAGSSLNLFARDYSHRVFRNPEAQALAVEQARLRVKDIAQAEDRIKGFDKAFGQLRLKAPKLVDAGLEVKRLRQEMETLRKAGASAKSESPEQTARRVADIGALETRLPAKEQEYNAARFQDSALADEMDGKLEALKAAEAQKADAVSRERELENRKATLLKEKGGFEIPTIWILTTNPFLVVVLGPAFALLWRRRSGKWPSSPVKFALALLCAGVGFFIIAFAATHAQPAPAEVAAQVSMGWLGMTYLFSTLGELCLSPVGLAYVSRLAPKQIGSQMMGIWFFASGLGSFVAGRLPALIGTVPLAQLFFWCAIAALAAAALLWLVVSRFIHKLMGGYS